MQHQPSGKPFSLRSITNPNPSHLLGQIKCRFLIKPSLIVQLNVTPESSGQPVNFTFNGFGYPKLYTCIVDIIIYVLSFPTWGLKYGMH